jgi:Uma2 family endonuclease
MSLTQGASPIVGGALLHSRDRRGERMGMSLPEYHTADMVRALISETRHWPRYETVHGELLVTPAPRWDHQEVVRRLVVALSLYIEREPIAHVCMSPADVSWGPDTLVQPDVFIVPVDEARARSWSAVQTLFLAIEVLSPGSVRADRFTKRKLYQEQGVPLYWLIDVDERFAEVWTPDALFPRVERDRLEWHPTGASAPFTMSIGDLLRPI